VTAGSTGNQIQGNYIGTNAAGTAAVPNQANGVEIQGDNNLIGGTTAAARNVISGNTGRGLLLDGNGAVFNLGEGNYVGTESAGMLAVANGANGISMINAANNNTIGGPSAGQGNVISGNQVGGLTIELSSTGNTVQGNLIGVAADGVTPLGNTPGSGQPG